MRKLVLIAGLAVVLAGCNKGPSTEESARKTGDIRLENASAADVAKQAAAAQGQNKIQSGEWENTVQIVSMDIPGMPEAMRKQMEAETQKQTQTVKECKKVDAEAVDFTKLGDGAQNCTFPKYNMVNGKIDADMVCKGPAGDVKMAINGTQTPTNYDITITSSAPVPGQTTESKTTIRASGKRLGDCKA